MKQQYKFEKVCNNSDVPWKEGFKDDGSVKGDGTDLIFFEIKENFLFVLGKI